MNSALLIALVVMAPVEQKDCATLQREHLDRVQQWYGTVGKPVPESFKRITVCDPKTGICTVQEITDANKTKIEGATKQKGSTGLKRNSGPVEPRRNTGLGPVYPLRNLPSTYWRPFSSPYQFYGGGWEKTLQGGTEKVQGGRPKER